MKRSIAVMFLVMLIVLTASISIAQEYKKGDVFMFDASLFWEHIALPFWDGAGIEKDPAMVKFVVKKVSEDKSIVLVSGFALFRLKRSFILPPMPIPMVLRKEKLDKIIEIKNNLQQEESPPKRWVKIRIYH